LYWKKVARPIVTLEGKTREEAQIWEKYQVNLLAIPDSKMVDYTPWRMSRFSAGHGMALLGYKEEIAHFYEDYQLDECTEPKKFDFIMNPESADFAELIRLSGSKVDNSTLREVAL
jgi:hypothetical protein